MVLRREAVASIGGIEVISAAIGDDTRLGRLLRRAHFRLRLAPFVIVHQSPAESAQDWFARYRRWLACHRTEVKVGFWLELLLNPTVTPLAAACAFSSHRAGLIILTLSTAVRVATTIFIDRALLRRHDVRLGAWSFARPLADIVHFFACISVVVYPLITWRGIRYRVQKNGDIVRLGAQGEDLTSASGRPNETPVTIDWAQAPE